MAPRDEPVSDRAQGHAAASIGVGGLAAQIPVRHGPPHPLGDKARAFPYSARCTNDAATISIENARPGEAFQSGQVVHGTVKLNNGGTGVLLMRAFVEARTLYWSFEPVQSQTPSVPKGGLSVKHENVISHEYHRAVFSSRRQPGERSSWTFDITLPTVIDGFHDHNECEGAPRDLQHYIRAPPPTLRDTRNASIEYVLEAVIYPSEDASPKLLLDERGMTDAATTDGTIVVRQPVSVMPSDHDTLAVDLAATPGFQVDPRSEAIVRRIVREQAPGAERFVSTAQLTGSLGRKLGTLTIDITTASPFIALRSAPSIILPITVSYAATGKSGLFGKASKDPAIISRFTIAFAQRISTRGGTDVKPHVLVQELFRETDACNMSVAPDAQVKHDLVLHLQTGFGQKGAQVDQEIVRAAELVPSLKLPNIEVEYILTCSPTVAGKAQDLMYILRAPVQLLAGDSALVHELTADERAAPAPAYTA